MNEKTSDTWIAAGIGFGAGVAVGVTMGYLRWRSTHLLAAGAVLDIRKQIGKVTRPGKGSLLGETHGHDFYGRLSGIAPVPQQKGVLADAQQAMRRLGLSPLMQMLQACPSESEVTEIKQRYRFFFPVGTPSGFPEGMTSTNRPMVIPDEFAGFRPHAYFAWLPEDTYVGQQNVSCQSYGSVFSFVAMVINAFRIMQAVNFDSPVPILGVSNLAHYFADNGVNIVFSGGASLDSGSYRTIFLHEPRGMLPMCSVSFVEPRTGVGVLHTVLLLAHEARHAVGDLRQGVFSAPWDEYNAHPHYRDDGRDERLSDDGAHAVQYWVARWMAQHAPSLSLAERAECANFANRKLEFGFAQHPGGQYWVNL